MIQSEKEEYDTTPLVDSVLSIGRKFYSQVEDSALRNVYSKTGFHLSSCNELSEFIESNIDELKEIIENDDYEILLRKIMDVFYEIRNFSPAWRTVSGKEIDQYHLTAKIRQTDTVSLQSHEGKIRRPGCISAAGTG